MTGPGGKGRGDQGAPQVSLKDLTPEQRVKRVQEQMEQYVDLVRKHAPAEEIKKAEAKLAREMGRDTFQAFKRQLPRQLRARRSLDAARVYQHFRLPGRKRVVHDRREHPRGRPARERGPRGKGKRGGRREGSALHLRKGKLVRPKERTYRNYLADRMQTGARAEARPETKARMDELLSKFERLIVQRFEGNEQVARKAKDNKPLFLKKTESQWKAFFSRFANRILKKRVPLRNVQDFLFRGFVAKGSKGIVISDMTLASGRVERFIRFSILADAMAKLAKMMPGQRFGKEMLSGEELLYLALAAARGREFRTGPKPTEGRFMGGVAEERAAQELGIPLQARTEQRAKELKKGKGFAGLKGWKDKAPGEEELPYQFIPWWHWGNLKPGGPHRSTTVAFYIGLGVVVVIGILAVTQFLLK